MGSKYQQDHAKRSRGFTSSQGKMKAFSSGMKNDEEEEEDPEAYKIPKVRRNALIENEDEEEPDLES